MARLSKRRRNINHAQHTTAMLLRFEAKVLGVTVSDLKVKKAQQEAERRRARAKADQKPKIVRSTAADRNKAYLMLLIASGRMQEFVGFDI